MSSTLSALAAFLGASPNTRHRASVLREGGRLHWPAPIEQLDRGDLGRIREIDRYISASDTESAVGFYLRYGCRLAERVDPTIAAENEPTDIHLVFDL